MNELSNEKIDAVIQELRTKSMDPKRWVDVYTVAIETIIDLREQLDKQWYMVNKDGYVKPLSDEEIKVIATQNRTDLTIPAYISFARAIEERHGIK